MQQTARRRHAPRARHAARRALWRRVLTVMATVLAVLLVGGSATAFVAYQRLNGNITRENVNDLIGSDKERPPKVAE